MGIFSNPTLKKLATISFVVGLVLVSTLSPYIAQAQGTGTTPPTTPTTPTVDYSKFKNPTCPSDTKDGSTVTCKYSSGVEVSCTLKKFSSSESPTAYEFTCKNPGGGKSVCSSSTGLAGSYSICRVYANESDTKPVASEIKDETPIVTTTETCAEGECDKSSVVNTPVDDAIAVALKGVALFILMLASTFLAWIGMAFNWVVINTVFDFGAIFGASKSMITAWGVMRDVGNIILLFGFILMGVLTILNLHDYPVKKTIPGLIIFAVLLNFSLFASQTVIDVANAFSAVFYEQASAKCEAGTDLKDCIKSDNGGISGIIAQQAGVTSAMNISKENHLNQSPMGEGIILLGLALFVTVAAIVLLAATIMLVIRAVVLCFLMVISPIGFAGMAIPPLKGLAKTWWQQLLKQAFFAPVFLLLIFVSLKLTEGISKGVLDSDKGLANALAGGTFGGMGIVVTFMVVIGFMIASLVAATKVGAMGAGFATNFAGAAVLGGMARVTNAGVGGAAWAARQGIQRTPLARIPGANVLTNRILRPAEKANMDLRRVPGMGALLGAAGIKAGAKPSEHIAFADMQHQIHDFASGKKGKELQEQYEGEVNSNKLEQQAHAGTLTADMVKYLGTLSTKELEGLHGIKEGLNSLAEKLSPEQFENLMKSDKLTDIEKGKLKQGRYKKVMEATTKDGVEKELKNMSKEDLENLPNDAFSGNSLILANLSASQRDDLVKSKKRTAQERQNIKDGYKHNLIKKAYDEAVAAGNAVQIKAALAEITSLNAAEASKLDKEILRDAGAAEHITPAMLERLASENKLSAADMKVLGGNIRARGKTGTDKNMRKYLKSPAGLLW